MHLIAVIEQSPSAIAVLEGPEHRFLATSGEYRRIVGGREVVGLPFAVAIPELVDQGFLALLDQVFSTGQPLQGKDVRAEWDTDGDGEPEEHWVDYVYQPLVDADGTTWGISIQVTDVTERHKAEMALRESEARFRAMFEASAIGTALVRPDGSLLSVNPALARMLGYAPEELRTRSIAEITHPDDVERDALLSGELLTGARDSYQIEKRYLRRDGSVVWGRLTGSLVRGGDGAPLYALGMVEDVTERIRHEQEREFLARASEELASSLDYQATLASITRLAVQEIADWCAVDEPGAGGTVHRIAVAHRDPARVELAAKFYETYPMSLDDPQGIPHVLRTGQPELVPFIPEEMLEALARDEEHLRRIRELDLGSYICVPLMAREQVLGVLTFVSGRNGRRFGERDLWMAEQLARRAAVAIDNARLFAESEESRLRVEETATELEIQADELRETTTQLEERTADAEAARARTEAILASIADAFYLLDREWRFTYVNDAAEPLLQTTRGRLLGRTLWEAFPRVAGSVFEASYREAMDTGRVTSAEAYFEPLGTWFDVRTYPWPGGIMVHFRDIGARKEAEAERERLLADAEAARAEAEAANRAKSEFLAVMSHELRTPLNAIGGYAQILEMGIHGPVTEAQHTALQRIQQSQRHLLGLINEVLNYARLEGGTVTYEITDVPLREVLASTQVLIEPLAQAKGLTLEVSECPATLTARADPEKLRQVLLNLASNAVKFTDTGGRIEISCAAQDDEVELRVRDTGIGIAADKLTSIFEPFVQVRADLTRTTEGTGLGLAISRDLARGMGGNLTVESTPGTGSTFTVRFPREDAEPLELSPPMDLSPQTLVAMADLLLEHRNAILGTYTRRMRQDPVVAVFAAGQAELRLKDHGLSFLAGLSQGLSTRAADPETAGALSDDSDIIQHTLAELHGIQRRRIGFSAEALRRDWALLREETARAMREHAPHGLLEAAAAMGVVEQIFDRAERISQRAWQRSAGTGQ